MILSDSYVIGCAESENSVIGCAESENNCKKVIIHFTFEFLKECEKFILTSSKGNLRFSKIELYMYLFIILSVGWNGTNPENPENYQAFATPMFHGSYSVHLFFHCLPTDLLTFLLPSEPSGKTSTHPIIILVSTVLPSNSCEPYRTPNVLFGSLAI